MSKTKLVWNDCDGYVELDAAEGLGYKISESTLIGKTEIHKAFEVIRVAFDDVPKDENEVPDFDGFIVSESGAIYIAA